MADVKLSVPSNELPYIVFAVANFVLVLALPAKVAVIIPVLKLPFSSLLTIVLGVLVEVAEAIALAILLIVDELTPPILFEELEILETTNAAVATSVPLAASVGVGAVTVPVNEGDEIVGDTIVDDTIVLDVNVSVPDKVASVPSVGKVTFVTPVLVKVVLKVPAVVNALAVVIFPPKVIVLPVLTTPVPPY
jgi:hypothetical protein